MPPRLPTDISRDSFIKKLRELGYSFQRTGDRVDIWKLSGSDRTVGVRRKDWLDESFVRSSRRQCGCAPDEVERFIGSCRC